MEIKERKRTKLWMKFTDNRQDEAATSTMIRTPDRRNMYRPPPPRPRPLKKGGATGFGFRLNVTVLPKFDQISLAFSTLLLILSLDLVIVTLLKSTPGILSSKFTPAKCRVMQKVDHSYTHCYVSTLNYHRGKKRLFPCLQIYVRIEGDSFQTTSSVTEATTMTTQQDPNLLLLYENELHLSGGDYLHSPCSFLPEFCDLDGEIMKRQVAKYAEDYGKVNSTIDCLYLQSKTGLNISTNGVAIKTQVVTAGQVAHLIIWPILGVIVGVACCVAFWKKNHHRSRRLFIYNAWSPS